MPTFGTYPMPPVGQLGEPMCLGDDHPPEPQQLRLRDLDDVLAGEPA